ncbi:MAG: cell division protein FtsQ/DivIB [Pseudomonadota bacterium]
MQPLDDFRADRKAPGYPDEPLARGRGLIPAGMERRRVILMRRFRRHAGVFAAPAATLIAGVALAFCLVADTAKPVRAAVVDSAEYVAAKAGFGIRAIVIEGDFAMPEGDIVAAIAPIHGVALPFFDVADARERLLAQPRIASATVFKLYPDTVKLQVTERRPFALWQNGQALHLIDHEGTVLLDNKDGSLETVLAEFPLFVGDGADAGAHALQKVIEGFPAVMDHMRAAIRVADRRWTLRLEGGVDVLLPEKEVDHAVAVLEALIGEGQVYDQPVLVVDMRLSDRITLTLEADAAKAHKLVIQHRVKGEGRQT